LLVAGADLVTSSDYFTCRTCQPLLFCQFRATRSNEVPTLLSRAFRGSQHLPNSGSLPGRARCGTDHDLRRPVAGAWPLQPAQARRHRLEATADELSGGTGLQPPFFTQKDVDQFTKKYESSLDDDIIIGNPQSAYAIYDLYKKRVADRIAKAKEALKQPFDFKSERTVEINRQKAPWPKDEADGDKIWHSRIENELLAEHLSKTEKEPVERITKRYDRLIRSINEQTHDDVVKIFLSTLAQTYDPHSEYLSKSELENFSINMRLSLVGIGAVLQSDEGYAKIMELVAGGPASKDGRLKVGDRVSGVAQGDKEFVDTVDMKLDKVVEMIRGRRTPSSACRSSP
jgi:hypothetical protein